MITFDKKYIFWQYPVITEKTFNKQNEQFVNYVGFPWATVIDKGYNLSDIHYLIKTQINKDQQNFTCCQHIHFRKLIPLFRSLNITRLYTPHKVKGEDFIEGVRIKPCPLYAVNIEDVNRNGKFKNVNVVERPREIFYSFIGAYMKHYISDVRKNIFEMQHRDDCVIENTGMWHFEKHVYSNKQNTSGETPAIDNSVEKYNELLLNSRYSLCPSGAGPNSIRFWESLGAGSIPVLLADTLELPDHDLWSQSIIIMNEAELSNLTNILKDIDSHTEAKMRVNCVELYNHFKDNFINNRNVLRSA